MNSEATLPPGPKGHFLVGSLPMLADNVLATLENWANTATFSSIAPRGFASAIRRIRITLGTFW
jgi:hypothetical protein